MNAGGTAISRLPVHEREINHVGGRLSRLYRYLRDNPPTHRDKIMHWCDFPSPRANPVIAYVEFANEVIRLDRILRRHGKGVEGGLDTGEVYRIVEARP